MYKNQNTLTDHEIPGTTERIAMKFDSRFLLGPRRSIRDGFDEFNRGRDPDT